MRSVNRILTRRLANILDVDAAGYIAAVQAADVGALEDGVKTAINNFVIGCKADGTWNAIKASCILAGARTLSGALVPLKGQAPTNFNFVSGDYNRKTGLLGNGSTKYLGTNRNNNADPQDNNHNAVWVSAPNASGTIGVVIGCSLLGGDPGANNFYEIITGSWKVEMRSRNGTVGSSNAGRLSGLGGTSRSNSGSYTTRNNGTTTTITQTSQTPYNEVIAVFACGTNVANFKASTRLAYYSIGESLSLALLDARLTTLLSAYTAAIP